MCILLATSAGAIKKKDPNSGTACLIELARGLGALLKSGWKPMRTIILCSWSGEELGMLGSTAWGEANAEVCMRWVVVRVQEGVRKGVTPREL